MQFANKVKLCLWYFMFRIKNIRNSFSRRLFLSSYN